MRTTAELPLVGTAPEHVFEHLQLLDDYPGWMHLVHRVEPVDADDGRPAWWVELRARVGPFARSKRLRMVRTEFDADAHHVRFERVEHDERDHANWILTVDVVGFARDTAEAGALVCVQLEYTGSLWTGGVLERVLDDEIRRGQDALARLVSVEPRR